MKTIKQIAVEVGVTKQAVQKRIARQPLKDSLKAHITVVDGTNYIDDEGEKIIKDVYKYTDAVIGTDSDVHMRLDIGQGTDKTIDTLISMLQNELEVKNKQIEDLSVALVAAQQTAQAAQALHAGTMQTQQIEEKTEKKSFLKRLFRWD